MHQLDCMFQPAQRFLRQPSEPLPCPLTQLALGQMQRGEASVIVMDTQPEMEPGNIVITSDDAQAAYDGTSEAALAQVCPCLQPSTLCLKRPLIC